MESWQPLSTFTDLPAPGEVTASPVPPPPAPPGNLDFQSPGKIQFDECLHRAWEVFRANWLVCILTTMVFFGISVVIQIPMQFGQAILERFGRPGGSPQPWIIVSTAVVFLFFWLTSIAVSSILSAGWMIFFIKTLRTNKANIDDLFSGFRAPSWIQILLAVFVWIVAVVLLVLIFLVPGIFLTATTKSEVPVIAGVVLMMIPVIYLSVGIGFVFPMIIDRGLGFREAIVVTLKTVHRQWFRAFGLLLLVGLIASLGVFACCVGLLASMPLSYLVWCQGYRQLFGDGEIKEQA